jgi:uroporphyrinogen-III synthase
VRSLAGRTVVVTRAADQAGETAELLSSNGAIPLVVSLIEVVDEPVGMSELANIDVAGIDWIVVTSPNGAKRAAAVIEGDANIPKVAAVGSATMAVLPRCDLVAKTQSAQGLLEVFPSGPGRAVVVQAADADPTLVEGLRQRAWDVTAITPYRTRSIAPSERERKAALAADAVLFASGSAARAWVEVFGRRTPPVVVAIGDQTSAAAKAAGLKVSVVSADHSMYGMLIALSRYFSDAN